MQPNQSVTKSINTIDYWKQAEAASPHLLQLVDLFLTHGCVINGQHLHRLLLLQAILVDANDDLRAWRAKNNNNNKGESNTPGRLFNEILPYFCN